MLTTPIGSSYLENWFESASSVPYSLIFSKQFCHVKARSWTWLSKGILCTYLMRHLVGIRCSTSSTIPLMKENFYYNHYYYYYYFYWFLVALSSWILLLSFQSILLKKNRKSGYGFCFKKSSSLFVFCLSSRPLDCLFFWVIFIYLKANFVIIYLQIYL